MGEFDKIFDALPPTPFDPEKEREDKEMKERINKYNKKRIERYRLLVGQYDIPVTYAKDNYGLAQKELGRYDAGEITEDDIFGDPDNILRNMMLIFGIHIKYFNYMGWLSKDRELTMCGICGEPIPPESSRKKYCSKRCASQARWKLNKRKLPI